MISTFNLEKLTALLKDFHTVTKIRITVFDEKFQEIAAWPPERAEFCRKIRTDRAALAACMQCDEEACRIAARRRSLYTYRCHAGLYESIMPIYLNSLLIGYLFFGHVYRYDSYESGWEVIRKCCADYSIRIPELLAATLKLPLTDEAYLHSASSLMSAIASYLCMERLVALKNENLPVRIDHFIQDHLAEETLGVDSILSNFPVGKTRLYEIARESYGCGIAEHIRRERIEKAKRLLGASPELKTPEISEACGFKDYNNFISLFHRITGLTPGQYRREILR